VSEARPIEAEAGEDRDRDRPRALRLALGTDEPRPRPRSEDRGRLPIPEDRHRLPLTEPYTPNGVSFALSSLSNRNTICPTSVGASPRMSSATSMNGSSAPWKPLGNPLVFAT